MSSVIAGERPGVVNVFQSTKAMMVKNLRPGLTECGKIKIGRKGEMRTSRKGNEFQPPEKLDHFLITTLARGQDGNFLPDQEMHKSFGERPTEIPVRLLFNDPWLSFQTVYTAFKGSRRFCTGDGETAQRVQDGGRIVERACPCELLAEGYKGDDKCKINGTLSVLIEGAPVVGGVWKLRTTSINTCNGIASSLTLLHGMTGGQLAGVPLMLVIRPKAAVTPDGQATTIYVVGLEYRGSIEELRARSLERAMADATYSVRMERVEEQARLLLAPPPVGTTDLEHVEEFYPEAAQTAHGIRAEPARPATAVIAPPPEAIECWDQHGEAFALQPAEVETWLKDRFAECDDVALKALGENNDSESEIGRAILAEIKRRAEQKPTEPANGKALNVYDDEGKVIGTGGTLSAYLSVFEDKWKLLGRQKLTHRQNLANMQAVARKLQPGKFKEAAEFYAADLEEDVKAAEGTLV